MDHVTHPEGGLIRDGRGAPPPESEIIPPQRSLLMASYRHPRALWQPSPNYWPGRLGHDMWTEPRWVVLHTMVCCEPQAWARFQQSSEQASSTYGVRLDGGLVQYVDESNGPWTDGTNQGKGSNLDVISIEHEDCGDYDGPRTPALYEASAHLVRDICTRYEIPLDREHVISHRECEGASTACPDSLDVDRIVAMAAGAGENVMRRDDWAAIYRALFTMLLRVPGAVQGDAAQRYESQVFADASLAGNPDVVMASFLDDVIAQREDHPSIPLLPIQRPSLPVNMTEAQVRELALSAVRDALKAS